MNLCDGRMEGTPETWQTALKIWALAEATLPEPFPIYIGHCFVTGAKYAEAAKIYGDLYHLATHLTEEQDFNECYLAYSAACSLIEVDRKEEAKEWLKLAAKFAKDEFDPDDACSFYGRKSQAMLLELS